MNAVELCGRAIGWLDVQSSPTDGRTAASGRPSAERAEFRTFRPSSRTSWLAHLGAAAGAGFAWYLGSPALADTAKHFVVAETNRFHDARLFAPHARPQGVQCSSWTSSAPLKASVASGRHPQHERKSRPGGATPLGLLLALRRFMEPFSPPSSSLRRVSCPAYALGILLPPPRVPVGPDRWRSSGQWLGLRHRRGRRRPRPSPGNEPVGPSASRSFELRSTGHATRVGGARQGREACALRVKFLGYGHGRRCTISAMTTHRLPPLYRYAWWLPGAWSALAVILADATLRPSEQSLLLAVAILCALPWSLALLLLDLSQGFADRAAVTVILALFANAAAAWWFTGILRARFVSRHPDDLQKT